MMCYFFIIWQGSWAQKILDRVYNVEKGRKRKVTGNGDGETHKKKRGRPKESICLVKRYPQVNPANNTEINELKVQSLMAEMEKRKSQKRSCSYTNEGNFCFTKAVYFE